MKPIIPFAALTGSALSLRLSCLLRRHALRCPFASLKCSTSRFAAEAVASAFCEPLRCRSSLILLLFALLCIPAPAADTQKIVLVAGTVKQVDRTGHHDYLGGCRLLDKLLAQTPGVESVLVTEGWPSDKSVFAGTNSIVFYTDGGGNQAYLETPERIATIQALVDAGTGIVSIHQAVDYPPQFANLSAQWIGATYNKALSGRGHWDSDHSSFPAHPVTHGVTPWTINDGWLNGFRFPNAMEGVTPLVYSGKKHLGSEPGGNADIVAWTFERPGGGRSFSFSGLDAHFAWELDGLRQLMVNGILWSAGLEIPDTGAASEADKPTIDSFLTPRTAPAPKPKKRK